MPHPGTHITVVQLLASSPDPADQAVADLFGRAVVNENASNGDLARRNRYACLGAVGPDLFYFLLDDHEGKAALQEALMRFYALYRSVQRIFEAADVVAGMIEDAAEDIPCVGDAIGIGINVVRQSAQTLTAGVAVLKSLGAELLIGGSGFNAFAPLSSPRQAGKPREGWFWADYLHYVHSGEFARNLLDLALLDPKYKGDPNLAAYAGGYLTHYVADVVGHPYVNQIVGGPYRLHRQRHTLVENFIDAKVWAAHHASGPVGGEKDNPFTQEPWLDRVKAAGAPGGGKTAEFNRARLHRLIELTGSAGAKDLSGALEDVVDAIKDAWPSGSLEQTLRSALGFEPDGTFESWQSLLIEALRKTYEGRPHPMGLGGDGFPTPDQISTAYLTAYVFMKMSTESGVEPPEPPDFGQIGEAAAEFMAAVESVVGAALDLVLDAVPWPGGSSFSFESFWEGLKDWAEALWNAAVEVVKAVIKLLDAACGLAASVVKVKVQIGFWLIRKAIYAAFSALQRLMALRAYAQPDHDLAEEYPDLWRSPGDPKTTGAGEFKQTDPHPIMELLDGDGAVKQDEWFTDLEPVVHPRTVPGSRWEGPLVKVVGADLPPQGRPGLDQMLWGEGGAGPLHDMFAPQPGPGDAAFGTQRDFGGIVPNCRRALRVVLAEAAKPGATTCLPAGMVLPDYNLDGDRGGGWTAWDIDPGTPFRPPGGAPANLKITGWTV